MVAASPVLLLIQHWHIIFSSTSMFSNVANYRIPIIYQIQPAVSFSTEYRVSFHGRFVHFHLPSFLPIYQIIRRRCTKVLLCCSALKVVPYSAVSFTVALIIFHRYFIAAPVLPLFINASALLLKMKINNYFNDKKALIRNIDENMMTYSPDVGL